MPTLPLPPLPPVPTLPPAPSLPPVPTLPSLPSVPTWKPKFTPSAESCRIKSYSETRARLSAGGTFFKSKSVGDQLNSIALTMNISTLTLNGFSNPSPSTHPNWNGSWSSSTLVVELKVEHTYSNYLNYYYVAQGSQDLLSLPAIVCLTHAPSLLRAQVTADTNAIIEMPTIDTLSGWNSSVAELTVCLLTAFPTTNLSGGDSGPAGSNGVRTGPEKAIIHIKQSEINSPTGTLQNVQQLRSFDGTNWVPYGNP